MIRVSALRLLLLRRFSRRVALGWFRGSGLSSATVDDTHPALP